MDYLKNMYKKHSEYHEIEILRDKNLTMLTRIANRRYGIRTHLVFRLSALVATVTWVVPQRLFNLLTQLVLAH